MPGEYLESTLSGPILTDTIPSDASLSVRMVRSGLAYAPDSPAHGSRSQFEHRLNEIAQEIALMEELGESVKLDTGSMVKELVLALQSQATAKPHPILYVNLAFVLSIAFACGALWTRVSALEAKTNGIEAVQTKVERLEKSVDRLGDRMDQLLDGGGVSTPGRKR